MPFGLTNALATFGNLMNDVFYEFVDHFVVVYLNDIVVYSESLEDHLEHLRKVLSKLREHQLYVKKEKCKFAQQEILFLRHKVSKGLMMMDKRKVHAILDQVKLLSCGLSLGWLPIIGTLFKGIPRRLLLLQMC